MRNLVYNTAHGQMTVNAAGFVILEFQNLYLQLSLEQFDKFVKFVNKNIHQLSGSVADKPGDSFYHIVLKNMKAEMIEEFSKLVNAPVFSPDDKFDIFDYLKEMKTKQPILLKSLVGSEAAAIDNSVICLN